MVIVFRQGVIVEIIEGYHGEPVTVIKKGFVSPEPMAHGAYRVTGFRTYFPGKHSESGPVGDKENGNSKTNPDRPEFPSKHNHNQHGTEQEKYFLSQIGEWRTEEFCRRGIILDESPRARRFRLLWNYKNSMSRRKDWGAIDPGEVESYVDKLIARF